MSSPLYSEIRACRACESDQLTEVLDLGLFAPSDFLESPDAFTDRAPLVVVRCQVCALVQLRHTVDRDRLYRRYWYRSGTQPAMVSALEDVVRDARARVSLQPGDTVIDIGANDGTLLRMYPDDVRKVAYEPAENLWPLLQEAGGGFWSIGKGINTIFGYFPQVFSGSAMGMRPGAKIITSIACFYDVDDPNIFVEGIQKSLAPDGVWINQLAYLPDTILAGNFGDIVHEHLTYWTISAFITLIQKHGLMLESWSHNDVNGGSVRLVVRHADAGREAHGWIDAVPPIVLSRFVEGMQMQRTEIREFLQQAKRDGKTVIGYGASTKGATYMQYWGVGPDLVETIADRNPDKWGRYTPTGQRVISEADARAMRPDYFLALPFHFIEAFVERERDYLESGGQFVVPFPALHVIGGGDDARLRSTDPPETPRSIQAA